MRILVVDDHALFRDGITSLLEASGFEIIGQAENGSQAIEAAMTLKPDLVLMDVSMPGMSGLDALYEIKNRMPEMQVVMLTVSDDDTDLMKAIQRGANGYLLKTLDSKAFLASLEALKRGEIAINSHVIARLIERISLSSPTPPTRHKLSEKELRLLNLIAKGLQNREIAAQMEISENTVKYHIKAILQKLGVKNRAEAVSYALQHKIITLGK